MKFIADVMVGKLARYLRMAGYDVLYENTASDDHIVKVAEKTGRVVLTRDTLMLTRRGFKNGTIKYLCIEDDNFKSQLKQLKTELKIPLEPKLTRCIECNNKLIKVNKEDVRGKVPPYVFKTQENFMYCKKCGKYYWRGTHYQNIKKIFLKIGE